VREYEVDLNEKVKGKGLLQLIIGEEDIENLELVLSLPKEGYKTSTKADLNLIDE
jgi:hypothetical protein